MEIRRKEHSGNKNKYDIKTNITVKFFLNIKVQGKLTYYYIDTDFTSTLVN